MDEMFMILFKAMKKAGISLDTIASTPHPSSIIDINSIIGQLDASGRDGEDGEPGPPGIQGVTGAIGVTGSQGSRGLQGIPGDPGEDGADGVPGAQGVIGSTGPTGSTGAQGPQGYTIQGNDGEDGQDAPVIPGPQGPKGDPGSAGSGVGTMGPPGQDGEDGDTWPQGISTVPHTGTGVTVLADSPALTTSPTAPTQTATDSSTKLATTAFVSTAVANAIAGVNPAIAVEVASAAILPNTPTYNNGVSGIGAFITTATTNTALVIDGYTPILGDRVLVKNEGDTSGLGAAKNGVYTVTQLAAVALAWILTRALDYDTSSDINNTGAIPVENHGSNALTSWLLTTLVTTVGTDALTYVQFSLRPPSEVTVTTTGNIDDLDFSNAATIRMNNAGLATLRGLKAGVAGQRVVIVSVGAGEVDLAHQNTGSVAANRLTNAITSGVTPLAPGMGKALYVYDATTATWRLIFHTQGAVITPGFSAGDYTGSGAMTITATAGEISTNVYYIVGNQVTWVMNLNGLTAGGTPGSTVQYTLPNGWTATATIVAMSRINDNAAGFAAGILFSVAANAKLGFQKIDASNWTIIGGGVQATGTIIFNIT
jgi:hypothetical protein